MKHTEQQIKEIALKVMNDIEFDYDKEIGINYVGFDKSKDIRRGIFSGKSIPVWLVSFEFGKPYFAPEALFLTISDETGEPLYFQHSTAVVEIEKDNNRKYYKKA